MRVALAVCALVLAAPATAFAAPPVISYVDGSGVFRLYDSESGTDVSPPPPVPAADPATFRYGISLSGRYIAFTDAGKKLHLLDRAAGAQVPLPGIDVYANPGSLSVSDSGQIAFDDGAGGAVVYSSATGQFAGTGLTGGHREPSLSGDGRFLATTCASGCVSGLGVEASPFVQDLSTASDTGFPNDPALEEARPCVDGDGSLVGFDKGLTGERDVHVVDRAAGSELPLTGLNATGDDTGCVLDRTGAYVGLINGGAFRVFQVNGGGFLTLPADRNFDGRSLFSERYTPPPVAGPAAPPPSGDREKPVTSQVRMTHRRFRPGRHATAFRFVLSEPAAVRIVLRRVGRYVGQLRRGRLNAGAHTISWNGRLRGRGVRPGLYAAVVIATDPAGNLSLPVLREFRVLRPAGDRRR